MGNDRSEHATRRVADCGCKRQYISPANAIRSRCPRPILASDRTSVQTSAACLLGPGRVVGEPRRLYVACLVRRDVLDGSATLSLSFSLWFSRASSRLMTRAPREWGSFGDPFYVTSTLRRDFRERARGTPKTLQEARHVLHR